MPLEPVKTTIERFRQKRITNATASDSAFARPASSEPNCARCQDDHWIFSEDRTTAEPCPDCAQRFAAQVIDRLRAVSGIPSRFAAAAFETADLTLHEDLPAMYAAGQRWVDGIDRPWLVVVGERGCGKTRLAASCGNALIASVREVRFLEVPDLLDEARGKQAEFGESERFQAELAAMPFLILDDLAVEDLTDWGASRLDRLFRRRYNASLPTLLTTNMSFDQLEKRMPRASSRMLEDARIVIVTQGRDLRETIGGGR